MYNILIEEVFDRYNQMRKTKRYRKVLNSYRTAPKGKKTEYSELLKQMQAEQKLTQYGIDTLIVPYRRYYNNIIHSQIAQKLALRVYTSLSKVMYGSG